MREFVISPEVAGVFAEQGVGGEPWKAVDIASVDCIACGGRERLDEDGPPLSVVIETVSMPGRPMIIRQRFAHSRCAPSAVHQGHPDEIEPRMSGLAVNLASFDGEAMVLFAPISPALAGGPDGALSDQWIEHFLENGLVRSASPSPPLVLIENWDLVIAPDGMALTDPSGDVQQLDILVTDAWLGTAVSRGRCLIATGDLDVADLSTERFLAALDSGRLALGLIPFRIAEMGGETR